VTNDGSMRYCSHYAADPQARQAAWDAKSVADTVAAAQAVAGCRLGSGRTTILLALGASQDVAITWRTPMPTATYSVDAEPGPGLIGTATLTVKSASQTGCVITVTASAAVAVGAIIYAHARTP
jgi:hypothetical protein